jgi:hypothetical protein
MSLFFSPHIPFVLLFFLFACIFVSAHWGGWGDRK